MSTDDNPRIAQIEVDIERCTLKLEQARTRVTTLEGQLAGLEAALAAERALQPAEDPPPED